MTTEMITIDRMTDAEEYQILLAHLQGKIESYSIADLRSMIYNIPVSSSGGCCYPAVQTLISLMELLGNLATGNTKERAFMFTFEKLGNKYADNKSIGKFWYKKFRHGIAHHSLAKGGVWINKIGNRQEHLENNGQYLDVECMFEDYLAYHKWFFAQLSEYSPVNYANLVKTYSRLQWDRSSLVRRQAVLARINILETGPASGASFSVIPSGELWSTGDSIGE